MNRRILLSVRVGLLGLLAAGCQSSGLRAVEVPTLPDVPVSLAPYDEVHVDWKQRLEQPYVFLELVGDYADTGRHLPSLLEQCRAQGVGVAGPPFGLFFDDPMRVPVGSRRSRLCVPVRELSAVAAPLGFDLLPAANVAYARVAGPYPEVPNSYPGVFDYLRERGWVLDGPIRETYLVDPGRVQTFDQLLTEVQMPWRPL